jgi:adenylate cyclase
MTKLNLRKILKKDGTGTVLQSLIDSVDLTICITDEIGNVVFGDAATKQQSSSYPIVLNDQVIGHVYGAGKTAIVGEFLKHILEREAERREMGAEVINLYQEINLIFNFSEKLAQTIDAPSICSITLEQAKHFIPSDSGVIVLWDEMQKELQVLSRFGEFFFEPETINRRLSLLLNMVVNGHSEIVADTASLLNGNIIPPEIHSVIYSSLKVNHRMMGAVILGSRESTLYTAAHLKLLTTLALQSSSAIESALLYEKNINEAKESEKAMRLIYEATGKFVPYEFIGALGHKVITDVRLGDQVERIVTVLFSDIRDYTTLSEGMTPEENFKFVCSFNERMGPAIRKHNGFINQYLGDAIMAIFPEKPSDALEAAIEMQSEVQKLNEEGLATNTHPIRIGIGIHTGPLIMGITGDENRMDAATISDAVNTASRLESITKQYKTSILISEACLLQIERHNYHLRYLGLVQLKGKKEPLNIYECFNNSISEEVEKKQKTLPLFNEGVEHFLNHSFDKSLTAFECVTEIDPDDVTAAFFLENARRNMKIATHESRTGVIEMANK